MPKPTLAQLEAETPWGAEYVPPALKAFGSRLTARLGCVVYYKGDKNHLYGRHRSRNWSLQSEFCTKPAYGTSEARDKAGPGDAIRATDIMISGARIRAVCRGLDEAVRAGRLPELAEWFGTLDGETVSGWYEGEPSSADSSHLTHLHLGFWTGSVEDAGFYDRLFDELMTYVDGGSSMLCRHGDRGPVVEVLQRMIVAAGGSVGTRDGEPDFDAAYGDMTAQGLASLVGGDGRTYGPAQYTALAVRLATHVSA